MNIFCRCRVNRDDPVGVCEFTEPRFRTKGTRGCVKFLVRCQVGHSVAASTARAATVVQVSHPRAGEVAPKRNRLRLASCVGLRRCLPRGLPHCDVVNAHGQRRFHLRSSSRPERFPYKATADAASTLPTPRKTSQFRSKVTLLQKYSSTTTRRPLLCAGAWFLFVLVAGFTDLRLC